MGGGTADIACHEIASKYTVKSVFIETGGNWGSRNINKKFIQILDLLFGQEIMKNFQKNQKDEYLAVLQYYEQHIHGMI